MALALAMGSATPIGTARAEPATMTERVEALLAAGIEPSEARHTIMALGPAGELALVEVFEREGAARYVRLRALSMLQSFESEATARYFAALVEAARAPSERLGALHPARSPLVLRRALEGLVPTGRLLTPPLDVGAVSHCLQHADPHVRRAAAQLLATFDDGRSQQALTMQLSRERSRMVRGTLEHALTSRSARRPSPR